MKIKDWVFYAAAFVASATLLVLWWTFGFEEVKALDFGISLVWWACIMASTVIVKRLIGRDAEDKRRGAQSQQS